MDAYVWKCGSYVDWWWGVGSRAACGGVSRARGVGGQAAHMHKQQKYHLGAKHHAQFEFPTPHQRGKCDMKIRWVSLRFSAALAMPSVDFGSAPPSDHATKCGQLPNPRAVVLLRGAYSRMYFAVVCTVMSTNARRLANEPRYFRPVNSSCQYTNFRFVCSTRALRMKP